MNNQNKKCEVCGQTKHISEFSKSYRNRCKACVAEHTREVRAAEKLTAQIKHTGETVEVEPSGTMQISCGSFITKDGRRIPVTALEFEKQIDWEHRRYEIAKDMLAACQSNAHPNVFQMTMEEASKWAVEFADYLIAELNRPKKQSKQSTNNTEIQVGEEYKHDGKCFICKEKLDGDDCSGCSLLVDDDCILPSELHCYKEQRQDKKNVVFVEKGGAK